MPIKHKKTKIASHIRRLLLTYCFFNTFPHQVLADEFDTLQFNASANKTWDNNLFRSANNESSDQITTYTAGVKLDKKYAQQRFVANLNYIDYRYQTNDFLDFDTINYDAAWQWTLTPALTGTISSNRNKSLAGFADYRTFAQNIRTSETNQFRAEYSPHKVWALIAGVTQIKSTNSQVFNAIAGYESKAFDYGARYNFASGSNFSFLGHRRSSDVQRELSPASLLDTGYSENEFEWDLVFKEAGRSNLNTKLAYLNREYDHFSQRDYNAWLGFIRYDVLLTGKIKANAELARTIGAFENNYSTYTITDFATLNLSYSFSEKLIFAINGRLAQRDFKQPVVTGQLHRLDDEKNYGVSVTWQPIRNVGVIVNTLKSSRNASNGYNQFDYDDVTTGVTLDLKI